MKKYTLFIIATVFVALFLAQSIYWFRLYKPKEISTEKRKYLSFIEAENTANNYDPTKEYFYIYTIQITNSRAFFPFINTKRDTVKTVFKAVSR